MKKDTQILGGTPQKVRLDFPLKFSRHPFRVPENGVLTPPSGGDHRWGENLMSYGDSIHTHSEGPKKSFGGVSGAGNMIRLRDGRGIYQT